MSKKKRKISELQNMRIQRDAYKGMMGYWKEEVGHERQEVARLREAIEGVSDALDTTRPDWPNFHEFVAAAETLNAALTTPADVSRHDAERDTKICELGNEVIRLTKLVARQRLDAAALREAE